MFCIEALKKTSISLIKVVFHKNNFSVCNCWMQHHASAWQNGRWGGTRRASRGAVCTGSWLQKTVHFVWGVPLPLQHVCSFNNLPGSGGVSDSVLGRDRGATSALDIQTGCYKRLLTLDLGPHLGNGTQSTCTFLPGWRNSGEEGGEFWELWWPPLPDCPQLSRF